MAREKRPKSQKTSSNNSSTKEGEYDLGKSFSRVRPYSRGYSRRPKHEQTTNSSVISGPLRSNQIDSIEDFDNRTLTGSTWTHFYTHLEDKLDSFSDKNDEAHTSLRQELEGKIDSVNQKCDKKISWSLFIWIIGGILVIASTIAVIWWNISYCEIIKLPSKVQQIENNVEHIDENLQRHSTSDSIRAIQKR